MNEMSAVQARPIELATEAPFQLQTLKITPAALEVRRVDQVSILEPRVMKVLVTLHRAGGSVVSREELLELCWEGRIVGDDSLNRSVSQLRKALAEETAVSVETIPRIGYRLRLTGTAEATPPAAAVPRFRLSRRQGLIALGVSLLLCCAAGMFILYANTPRTWSANSIRPLTQAPGIEVHPALSPDGISVAYAAGPGLGVPRDIYIGSVNIGDSAPTRITNTLLSDETFPAWSPNGERLAFLRQQQPDGPCTIVMMSPPNGTERVVGQCSEPYAGLAWMNERELVYGDREPGVRARRLHALDVVSGTSRPLTTPPATELGDAAPAVSASGRWLAFRRSAALGSDAIFVLDSHSGQERKLTDDGWKASGFTWADDEQTLFFSSNRGGDFGLWAMDARQASEPQRITLGMLPLGRLSADRSGRRMAVETGGIQANLTQIAADGGSAMPVTSGDGIDWDPDVAPDGSIIFASDRNGTNQIWTLRPNGHAARLTDLDASYVHSPRWSPDGQQAAFIAVVGGRTDIYSVHADGSRLTRITSDGTPKGRVAWSAEAGQIFFTHMDNSGWQLVMQGLATGRSTPVPQGAGITIIQRLGERMFGRRSSDRAIVEIEPRSGAVGLPPVPIESDGMETWAPRADGILHTRQNGSQTDLWLTTWSGDNRRLATLHQPPRATFATAPDGSIVASQLVAEKSDLMLITVD